MNEELEKLIWDCILFEEEKKKLQSEREQFQLPTPEIPYWEDENK